MLWIIVGFGAAVLWSERDRWMSRNGAQRARGAEKMFPLVLRAPIRVGLWSFAVAALAVVLACVGVWTSDKAGTGAHNR